MNMSPPVKLTTTYRGGPIDHATSALFHTFDPALQRAFREFGGSRVAKANRSPPNPVRASVEMVSQLLPPVALPHGFFSFANALSAMIC
jgi:hypothetical protein